MSAKRLCVHISKTCCQTFKHFDKLFPSVASGVATIDTATNLRAQTNQQKKNNNNNVTFPVRRPFIGTFDFHFATSGLQSQLASCCSDYSNDA